MNFVSILSVKYDISMMRVQDKSVKNNPQLVEGNIRLHLYILR